MFSPLCDLFIGMTYLQEMLATSMRGINERFDRMEKAIQVLVEQQKTNEKKLDELMASKVFKSKVIVIIKDFNFKATCNSWQTTFTVLQPAQCLE